MGVDLGELAGLAGIVGGGIMTATGVGAGVGVPLMATGAGLLGTDLTNQANAGNVASTNAANAANAAAANSVTEQMQKESEAFNSEEAQKNRDYQTEMSNTAYQRSVSSMEAAGLNPVLAGMNQSSASTPSGSTASVGGGSGVAARADSPDVQNVIGAGLSSALQMKSLMTDIDAKGSQMALNDAMATKALQDAKTGSSSARSLDVNTQATESQLKAIAARAKADAAKAGYDASAAGYDAVMSRASRDSGTAKNVMDMMKGFFNVPSNSKLPKGTGMFDKNTGEILTP